MKKEVSNIVKIKDGNYEKIDAVIKDLIPPCPRSQLRAYFHNYCVTLNGKPCHNPGTKLKNGDEVGFSVVVGKVYKEKSKKPLSVGFEVVYEDGHLIVVNKEAGVLSVPTFQNENDTLVDKIKEYLHKGIDLHVVHRLDRDTSGLLVFAKSMGIARRIKEQFEKRKPERIYDAFVKGIILDKKGTFKSSLATDEDLNQYSVEEGEEGKLAITHYVVEKKLNDATWVKVKLETGRRNQIRVHFSESGHPVLGDQRYEVKLAKHPNWKSEYLALHAATLSFFHPASGKKLSFKCELPERMRKFLVA